MSKPTPRALPFTVLSLLLTTACTPEATLKPPHHPADAVVVDMSAPAVPAQSLTPPAVAPRSTAKSTTKSTPATLLITRGLEYGGPSSEDVRLTADGTLSIGKLTTAADLEGWDQEAFRDQAKLRIIMFDRIRTAAVLALPGKDSEDPPTVYQVFVVENGAIRRILHQPLGAYGHHDLRFRGGSNATYREDGWTACNRLDHPVVAARQDVTLKTDSMGMLVESSRRDTKLTVQCGELGG